MPSKLPERTNYKRGRSGSEEVLLSLGQTRVSLGDRAARRWGWGGPDPAAGDMGLIYAHTARHAGFGRCHHTGKETESLAAQSVIRGLKARGEYHSLVACREVVLVAEAPPGRKWKICEKRLAQTCRISSAY